MPALVVPSIGGPSTARKDSDDHELFHGPSCRKAEPGCFCPRPPPAVQPTIQGNFHRRAASLPEEQASPVERVNPDLHPHAESSVAGLDAVQAGERIRIPLDRRDDCGLPHTGSPQGVQ